MKWWKFKRTGVGANTPLARALREGIDNGDLGRRLDALEKGSRRGGFMASPGPSVTTGEEAELVAEALDRLPPRPADGSRYGPDRYPLHALAGLFQQIGSREAGVAMRDVALPKLVAAYDRELARYPTGGDWKTRSDKDREAAERRDPDDDRPVRETPEDQRGNLPFDIIGDLHFILKMFAAYGGEAAIERLIAAARDSRLTGGFLWSVIFRTLGAEDAPAAQTNGPRRVVDALRNPLPTGFTGVAYLDFCNALAHADRLDGPHPFSTEAGVERLRGWLSSSDEEDHSYAHSATAALAFVDRPERGELLALAMDHVDEGVQLEAAYAAAKQGSAGGIRMLADATLERPHLAQMAAQYLQELDRTEAIPPAFLEPQHLAKCEMAAWLNHPQEFGRPPDALELVDDRTLHWPPTNDERRLFVFRYRYDEGTDGEPDVGHGLVGSVTFALFGETTGDLSPEDVLGLHCCWELEGNGDPRAPKQRSAAAGRKLLGI